MKKLIAFFKEEDGLELSEYAVMGALIVVALVGAVSVLSGAIGGKFGEMTDVINNGAPGTGTGTGT